MKKWLMSLAMLLFCAEVAFAGPVSKTLITATTLDDDPTYVTSDSLSIYNYDNVAFFVHYDETEVGNSIQALVTLDISYDGTNWVDAYFYDFAGGTTPQANETISSDGNYYFWFSEDMTVPFVKLGIDATNTDADDTLTVSGYLVGTK